jgi:septal ring-binding cell division protein DamX
MNKLKVPFIKALLLIYALLLSWHIQAKESDKDTNIVCFAAQKKWICAPKDNQDIAQEKAGKLIKQEASKTETQKSEVVVRSLNIPKMQAIDYSDPNPSNTGSSINDSSESMDPEPIEVKVSNKDTTNTFSKPINIDDYSKYWSYQLVGVSTQQAAIKFVQKNNLSNEDIMIVESEHNTYEWFVVLYKLYNDKDSAAKDQYNLPTGLNKPWLRPLNSLKIKSIIKEF